MAAIETVRASGGLILAERNARMPFVLGDTVPATWIDYLIDTDYPLPVSPVRPPGDMARRIGRIIAERFITDRCTIQYGIGQVPEAVTDAILDKGLRDLGIHTELFADAMCRLVDAGVVTNRFTATRNKFSDRRHVPGGDHHHRHRGRSGGHRHRKRRFRPQGA